MTPNFFEVICQEFHDKWPVPSPTTEEIVEAGEDGEKSKTTKQKASEIVGCLFLLCIYIHVNIHIQANSQLDV